MMELKPCPPCPPHQWSHAPTVGYIRCCKCGERHEHDSATYKAVLADQAEALAAMQPEPAGSEPVADADEAYALGKDDGYSAAIADVDRRTGGDGEYFASTIPGRGCPDPKAMLAGIIERFTDARAEVERLKAENATLTRQITSQILPGLLTADEKDAMVDLIKHLRANPDVLVSNPRNISPKERFK